MGVFSTIRFHSHGLELSSVGLAGETNVQGEEQKKLDVLSNDIMVNALRASGKTAVLVSEELDNAIIIEERNRGKYCVVFDPLDGSSNIDAGVNIGTIFGIYQIVSSCSANTWVSQSSLQSGSCRDRIRKGPSRMCFGRAGRWLQLDTQCTRLTSNFAYMVPSYSPRYGSSANLVLSTGSGVNGYTLDASLGEFILTHPDVSPTDAR